MSPKQETITMFLSLMSEFLRACWGWVLPSPHLTKLGLTVNVAILSGGKNSPLLVLHLYDLTLSEWEGTESEVLAKLVLLSTI